LSTVHQDIVLTLRYCRCWTSCSFSS